MKDDRKRKEILSECSELQFEGIFYQDNEIYSMSLGEQEQQIDDELWEDIKKLSDSDFELLRGSVNCYLREERDRSSGWGYFNHDSDRWILALSADALYRKLQDIPGTEEVEPKTEPAAALISRLETKEERRAVFKLIMGGAA